MSNIVNQIVFSYLNNKSFYIGEKITMSEHMIQTAMLDEENNSSANLVCSSLLHDYEYFILDSPDSLINKKKDGKHERLGYEFLKKYYDILSKASKASLKLQDGIMKNEETKIFEKNEFFEDSIKLRKFDELRKKTKIKIKSINKYKKLLISKLI